MALTLTQKAQIRRYLGYPDVNRLQNYTLEGALSALSDEGEVVVEGIMAELATVDTQRAAVRGRAKGLSRVEDVHYDTSSALADLNTERRRLVADLGNTLNVQPMSSSGNAGYLLRG